MNGLEKQGWKGNQGFGGGGLDLGLGVGGNRVDGTPKSRGSRKDNANAEAAGQEETMREVEARPSPKDEPISNPFPTISEDPTQYENNSSMMPQPQNPSMLHSHLHVDMTASINTYFDHCTATLKDFQEHRGRFVLPVNHRIKKLIKNGEIEVSDKCEVLDFKEKSKMKRRRLEEQRRIMEIEKGEVIRRLKGIEQEEIELIHRAAKELRNRSVDMKKVEYTPEEKQRMKELVKSHRLFQKSLQEKTELYNQSVQARKKQQQQARRKQKDAENMVKKEQIAKKLKQISQKSEERKESLKNSILKVPHQYMHRQLEKRFKSVQKLSKLQTQQKLKEISQRHKLNIDQINQHDRKYTEHLEKRSQSLSTIKLNLTSSRKRQQGYFSKVVDEELFQLRQKNYIKLMKVKENQYKQKILKYQEKVSKEFKPKVDPSLVIPTIPRTYSSVTLTNQERLEKGLEYLALAKEMRKSSEDITEPSKEAHQPYGNKAYKDYLRERQPKNKNASETQLKQIMSNPTNDFSSIQRAKYLVQALQAKSKKDGDAMQFHSAMSKLSLLSQLY